MQGKNASLDPRQLLKKDTLAYFLKLIQKNSGWVIFHF